MGNNETIELILGRRSVRKFEARNVEPEKAQILLECAFAAPSSKNYRPCHFIRIDDRDLLKKIGAATPAARMAGGAGLAIAVCVDLPDYESRSGLTDGTWLEDCACAMENILIAARALGLEGVFMQVVNREDREGTIPQLLGVPSGVKVFALAVLGYAAEDQKAPALQTRFDETRLHKNSW